ncbi:beta subunit of N-acylethanolamine-hydrolyzing acid amidase-domain-containing protein [Coprinopsis sp. MPI-PUGE-AT-0042]|nr:beta subunit of N-acylethanolamine-hydrolyzing acid amidase-domain-containing protein [Coprinopsis sp. MPI-PUGE-AT-0042]
MSTSSRTTGSSRRRVLVSGGPPPRYTIDLSRPPRERHSEICRDFKEEMWELTGLFDSILELIGPPKLLHFLAKLGLRRVRDQEENEEIKGISRASGIPVHLIVAYNSFLDILSGCASGGVKEAQTERMLHFRGLDWGMEPLRAMVIQVEYMRDGKVVARAVTYAGYVGALTGVREGLSVSLNYRSRCMSLRSVYAHRWHQLCVLLGRRRSISSELRHVLLSPAPTPALSTLGHRFKSLPASPCYLTFCSPTSVMTIEKDLKDARIRVSSDFLAVTNHDVVMEGLDEESYNRLLQENGVIDELLEDSVERKECLVSMWRGRQERGKRDGASLEQVKQWLRTYPVRNECTHFSCIMDPSRPGGGIRWAETFDGIIPQDIDDTE